MFDMRIVEDCNVATLVDHLQEDFINDNKLEHHEFCSFLEELRLKCPMNVIVKPRTVTNVETDKNINIALILHGSGAVTALYPTKELANPFRVYAVISDKMFSFTGVNDIVENFGKLVNPAEAKASNIMASYAIMPSDEPTDIPLSVVSEVVGEAVHILTHGSEGYKLRPIGDILRGEASSEYHLVMSSKNFIDMSNEELEIIAESLKTTLSSLKKQAVKLPKEAYDKIQSFKARLEKALAEYRMTKDEEIRDKLMAREFSPLLDDLFSWVLTAGVATTLAVVSGAWVGILSALVGAVFINSNSKKRRAIAIKKLKQELEIIEKKLQMAESDGDKQNIVKLTRIKHEVETMLAKVRLDSKIGRV